MDVTHIAPEKLFFPRCGREGAYDCTGEGDWVCRDDACAKANSRNPFDAPLRERDLNQQELVRLRLENARLIRALDDLHRYIGLVEADKR
jgi:hypothetical protein